MSDFRFWLSFREVKIIKHSLEKRIENDKADYDRLKKLDDKQLTEKGRKFMKDHEEHIKCLESFIESMQCVGYMHGTNVFGEKYRT